MTQLYGIREGDQLFVIVNEAYYNNLGRLPRLQQRYTSIDWLEAVGFMMKQTRNICEEEGVEMNRELRRQVRTWLRTEMRSTNEFSFHENFTRPNNVRTLGRRFFLARSRLD